VAHHRTCRGNNPPCHAIADFEQALKLEPSFSAEEFQGVLIASRLAERRPSDDMNRLNKMLQIIVAAHDDQKLVGIPRHYGLFILPLSARCGRCGSRHRSRT
jgi:hypothetical protein